MTAKPKKKSKSRGAAPIPVRQGKNLNQLGRKAQKPRAWKLRLYIAGMSSIAAAALDNLQAICEEHLGGTYQIEVIDLLKNPQLAAGDQIVAVPTLVRRLPTPVKKIIGDLSNTARVLVGLDIRPIKSSKG